MDTKQTTKNPVAKRQSSDFTDQLIEPFTHLRTQVDRLFEKQNVRRVKIHQEA